MTIALTIPRETPVGYALFKAKSKKLKEGYIAENDSVEDVCSKYAAMGAFDLKEFHKFDSAVTALEQSAALIEGKVTPRLSTLLDTIKDEAKASLAVADPKLASAINKLPQLDLKLLSDSSTNDIYRAIRQHLPSLIPAITPENISTMSLGLSHSLSRHKLKFSADKVDTMIIQAISLLDDLDKELNIYAMRVREWYGWHFPEMAKIVNDNLAYARIIFAMGMRSNAANADLAEILPEEIEGAVKAAAEISMGTEITEDDLENIKALAEQVVQFTEYRSSLSSYLAARMAAVAPNLTALVGDLVGARLIAHSGSLMNLAKSPASTIQILGAEKALFRALKTKHDTPKYGLIYHSSLIGQATGRNKGKIARVLATKASLGMRVDALADWSQSGGGKGEDVPDEERNLVGVAHRQTLERRLAALENKPIRGKGVAIAPNGVSHQPGKWEVKEARKYNPDADGLIGDEPAAFKEPEKKKKKLIEEVVDEPPKKKVKVDKSIGERPVEELVKSAMKDNSKKAASKKAIEEEDKGSDISMDSDSEPELKRKIISAPVNGAPKGAVNGDDKSDTLSTVSADTPDSPDSPTQQERNWQSPIEGNTKAAKKARKEERHARKVILHEERIKERTKQREKHARKLARKQRRDARSEQIDRRKDRENVTFKTLAEQAGLSIVRYKRKLDRGEIKFDADGKPHSISKKDIKKARKHTSKAESASNGQVDGKKRKRAEEDDADALAKAEKKRRKEAKKAAKAKSS
ncbi:Nucleolar protein 58 [Bacidia gigantensis]|uniref:Nucleolar protein 58 n=1 Tax=Bacidia gigantensis TaxID=2732470 RepID=UPI001D039D7A|nr:Nucleolar protein 58 [Bacidia gigantensis]KAG8528272.1 Nucleolar protein 58 [Bacidia gigantensis]